MNAFSISPMVVERLGWVLVHSLWQFALIALLASVTVRLLRRHSAALRYGVLGVVSFVDGEHAIGDKDLKLTEQLLAREV